MRLPAVLGIASLLAFCVLLLGGCLPAYTPGGDPSTSSDDGGGGNGGGGGGASAGSDLAALAAGDLGSSQTVDLAHGGGDLALTCDKQQSTGGLSSPSGHHNAGQECQRCHAPGQGAPTFYVGGTLYSAVTGGAAVAGATINVTDAGGKKVKIVSANNGNFWTTTSLTFPLTVDASLCPATAPMTATVAAAGACNNCHNSTFRVHVP